MCVGSCVFNGLSIYFHFYILTVVLGCGLMTWRCSLCVCVCSKCHRCLWKPKRYFNWFAISKKKTHIKIIVNCVGLLLNMPTISTFNWIHHYSKQSLAIPIQVVHCPAAFPLELMPTPTTNSGSSSCPWKNEEWKRETETGPWQTNWKPLFARLGQNKWPRLIAKICMMPTDGLGFSLLTNCRKLKPKQRQLHLREA